MKTQSQKLKSPIVTLAAALGIALIPTLAQADNGCSDILSQGIFNTLSFSENESLRQEFKSWLCTTEFHSHQDAMNAGIGLGIPVYGVPVKLDGTFSDSQRDEWKKTNCQSGDNTLASDQALSLATRNVSTEIVDAWKDCMDRQQDQKGLSCQLRASDTDVQVTVRYAPSNDLDAQSAAVVAVAPQITGATCAALVPAAPVPAPVVAAPAPGLFAKLFGHKKPVAAPVVRNVSVLAQGSAIPVQGYTFLCTRDGNGNDGGHPEIRFVLNTNKGSCSPSVSPASEDAQVFSGNITYTADFHLIANRVVFKKGTVIRIENGATYELSARKVTFEDGVFFDGRGATGAKGPTGNSVPGTWSEDDRGKYDSANGDCSNWGGHPDRGGRGGTGGTGGAGANLVFHMSYTGDFQSDLSGGVGGPGGDPGQGRWHRYGGNGDLFQCPNNGSGDSGASGPKGSIKILPGLDS
jgi:hypothetical protein